jgi:serralysin
MTSENTSHFCMAIMPPERTDAEIEASGVGGTKGALLNEFGWDHGSTITVSFLEGSKELQRRVREAAEEWLYDSQAQEPIANLTLSFLKDDGGDIRIAFMQGDGSWSYIGTYCSQVPDDQPTMNFGWLTPDSSDEDVRSVVLHEFGHALGLIHEHQNPENAIQWNEAAVIADLSGPPNNWDPATIRRNVLDRYDPEDVTTTPVDEDSIMMYPIPASWTNGTFSADFNGELSPTDKAFIRQTYP